MERHTIGLQPGLNVIEYDFALPNVKIEEAAPGRLTIYATAVTPGQRLEAHQPIPDPPMLAIRMHPHIAIDLAKQILARADELGLLLPKGTAAPRQRR